MVCVPCVWGCSLNYSPLSYPCVCLVGDLPLSSTDTELRAKWSLSLNLLCPGAGMAPSIPARCQQGGTIVSLHWAGNTEPELKVFL